MPVDECVQQILSKKLGKGEKPSDQDLAIAFSECREKTQKIAQIKNQSVMIQRLQVSEAKDGMVG